ncbi:MAG: hypothetical protein MJB57_13085 [Gemmatimonadetes bacterium]|nr:hypothetical protein [Gemmatimonadota bacterium]
MKGRYLALAVAAVTTGCEGSPFLDPEASLEPSLERKELLPDLQYRVWWDELQACAGTSGDFARLRFYEVVSPLFFEETQFPCGQGFFCNGMWEAPHDIILAPAFTRSERLVKHEMLHDLLATVEHPPVFDTCDASWDFGDPGSTRRPFG